MAEYVDEAQEILDKQIAEAKAAGKEYQGRENEPKEDEPNKAAVVKPTPKDEYDAPKLGLEEEEDNQWQ